MLQQQDEERERIREELERSAEKDEEQERAAKEWEVKLEQLRLQTEGS